MCLQIRATPITTLYSLSLSSKRSEWMRYLHTLAAWAWEVTAMQEKRLCLVAWRALKGGLNLTVTGTGPPEGSLLVFLEDIALDT